jgi:SNF family Na+-dependent transporter
LITFLLNFLLIYRGVTYGIETFCKISLSILVVCALCVLFLVLTLGTPDPAYPDQ